MSSDSSDSEGDRQDTRRRSSSDSNSNKAPASPPAEDSKGPKTPGSPVSNKSFESLSPEGPQSPTSPRQSRSRSRSAARSPSNSPDRAGSNSRSVARSEGSRSRSASPAPKRGPRSPPDNFDDDGRSNISSGSSILSRGSPKPQVNGDKSSPAKVPFSVPNAEDLSDVSDIGEGEDELGSEKDSRETPRERERREPWERDSRPVDDDADQLDFEVEDQADADKEDGECDREKPPPQEPKETEKPAKAGDEEGGEKSGDEGEVKEEDAESLEEGEVSDDGDPKPEKPPICRFYSRGACTWGNNCRFLHPGVTDKGNYSMFETTRPIVAGNGLGLYPPETRPYPLLLPPSRVMPSAYGPVVRREDPAAVESAWERGLRQAKELMRISTKRKESDMDFEDKKMNMSIGQDEMDKENDYYTRVASPAEPEAWPPSRLSPRRDEGELRRPVRVVERYEDIMPDAIPPPFDRFDHRRLRNPEYMLRRDKYGYGEEEGRKSKKMVREVIMQRGEKAKRMLSPDGRKPDEWRDPWMRTRSPAQGKHRSRKVSYSSRSSSYSGSSSRSSSNSSYSSYSRSRSRSRSGSRSPVSRRRPRSPPPTGIPVRPKGPEGKFKPAKTTVASAVGEKPAERSMLMNPPAPSPLRTKRPLTPNTAIRKTGLNPPAPAPIPAKPQTKAKLRSKKSRSSSGSSGSSSDSSHSSYSSSSSGSSKSPPARSTKKGDADLKSKEQRLAAKAKADKLMPTASIAGKKRPAPASEQPDAKGGSPEKGSGSKKGSSRRDELLKQLKAVEDAIARKRSKI